VYWYRDTPQNALDAAGATNALLNSLPARLCDWAYWAETGSLVMEYFRLQAGAAYSKTLRQGFITWLKRSPAERGQYVDGDDMRRAALVDWYLKVVR
jgi:hypothetical protein